MQNGDFTKDDLLVDLLVPIMQKAIEKATNVIMGNHDDSKEDIATIEWVCAVTKKAKPTIYLLTSKKAIPHYHQGRRLYFSKAAIREWMKNGS
ncbi:MAG: helix-turn-helix domain-containing protein [Bacteroidota bacterium]